MPEQVTVPYIPQVSLGDEPFKFSYQNLEEAYAITLVTSTFTSYEGFRQNSHDPRWNMNDMLYAQYVPQRTWPGSDVPRSSLGMGLVFEQVEGALPHINQALFSNPEWFAVEADFGADPQAARGQQAHLEYSYERSCERRGMTPTGEMSLAFKDILLYGNGGVAVEYDPETGLPGFYRVDPRDLYIDPFCNYPSIDGCRSVVWRKFLSVEEIRTFRNDKRMNVPSDEELWSLAQSYQSAQADRSKQAAEAARGVNFSPEWAATASMLPSQRPIEVLVYLSKERIIWVLGRQHVLFNSRNPYGFIPIAFAPCYTWPGRYYSMSLADAQEQNQRYMEAIFNGRLDNLALALHPPRIVPRGLMITAQQQKWGPGAQFGSDSPKDLQWFQPQADTSGVYQELGFIQQSADRKTGINSMASSGIPTPSNANRTAGGVNAQLQGTTLRLYTIIKNIEDYLIIPLIQKSIKMVRVHAQMGAELPGKARNPQNPEETQYVKVSSQSFLQATRVHVRAASKMLTRDRLMQEFPFVSQTLLAGPVIQALAQTGYTVDFMQYIRMMMDATGVDRYYQLIRPLNDEEKKAQQEQMKAQEAAKEPLEMKKAQLDSQTRLQMGQMAQQSKAKENETDLQIAQMKSKADPMEAQMKQQEMATKAQFEQQKMQMGMYQKLAELEFKKKELEMKIEHERIKLQTDAQRNQMEMANDARRADMEGRVEQMKHSMSLQQQAQQTNMDLQSTQAQSAMKHENMAKESTIKQDHQKSMNQMKQKSGLSMNERGRPRTKEKS